MASKNDLVIVHMASMARSGETLLQRCFGAHPSVVCAHNVEAEDSAEDNRLFAALRELEATTIRSDHELLKHKGISGETHLLLKQGVWEHRFDFRGFVLCRNPVSIYASLKVYDSRNKTGYHGHRWSGNHARLLRWMANIDPQLLPQLKSSSPVDQFALFYNRRMGHLGRLGKATIRYEDFVRDPGGSLDGICKAVGIEFDDRMIRSHESFGLGEVGHGKNDLSSPISDTSITKYQSIVTPREFKVLADRCGETAGLFGYNMENYEIQF